MTVAYKTSHHLYHSVCYCCYSFDSSKYCDSNSNDKDNGQGYQIKGTAEYVTDGAIVAAFKTAVEGMFKGAATAKGALIITPSKVIVTTPGADNKKEI